MFTAALAALVLGACTRTPEIPPGCAGPPLHSVEKREAAMQAGYEIIGMYDCISKASYDEVQAQLARAKEAKRAERPALPPRETKPTLAEARKGFRTLVDGTRSSRPLPAPPPALFLRIDYPSGALTLPAFVSPDPGDGRRHPAIIWLTGGETNSLDRFWVPGPDAVDESAHQYRDAGAVMMFPVLRGGNGSAGTMEYLMGEVDDVVAAAEHLASLPYVNPHAIYLGGHSTGGTLALLAAEAGGPFRSVIVFGPVSEASRYPRSIVPIDFPSMHPRENELRSPIHWLDGIATPTYVVEGDSGNVADLDKLCAATTNANVHCVRVPGADHFAALARANRVIAERITSPVIHPILLDAAAVGSENPAARARQQ